MNVQVSFRLQWFGIAEPLASGITYLHSSVISIAPHTINVAGQFKLGSAGKELPGMKTKIDKPDADGNGEVSTKLLETTYCCIATVVSVVCKLLYYVTS